MSKWNKSSLLNKLVGRNKKEKKSEPKKIPINIDYEAEISFGKYKGKKLGWVKEVDNKYFCWMRKEGMIVKWSLVKPEKTISVEKKKCVDFISSNGEIWVDIREHELLESTGLCKYLID